MKFRYLLFLFLFGCQLLSAKTDDRDSTKVLFIGNSYTYYHDLPQMVKSIAASIAQDYRMQLSVRKYTPGGCTFQRHLTMKNEIAAIKEGDWDYVVLQEQSANPAKPTDSVLQNTYPYARQLTELVRRYNPKAKIIFYMTWGHKDGCQEPVKDYPLINTYAGMQERLITSYLEMAYRNNAWCAPVGMAWKRVRSERPYLPLYWPDGSHPSTLGTYLAANVIFATIFQRPFQSTYSPKLDAELAEYIQQIAQQTVLQNKVLLNLN